MLVVLDGPEKAGKTTLASALVEAVKLNGEPTRVRKWGKLDDGKWAADWVYAKALEEDSQYPGVVVWDRSWASEAVYGKLLKRDRRLAEDPWLGEWLYGRGVALKYILAGPDPKVMTAAHDAEDLPVEASEEQAAFVTYGEQYGWRIFKGNGERLPLNMLVSRIAMHVAEEAQRPRDPRKWCGPQSASVVFVGERGSTSENIVGGWLPFTSIYTAKYGRILGDAALRVGWTNAWDDERHIFDNTRCLIACGASAYEWAREVQIAEARSGVAICRVTHPAALYRWGRYRSEIDATEAYIRDTVGQYIAGVGNA